MDNIISTLISVLVILFSLSIHECAHGWTAYKLGDGTAMDSGRLTLNPIAHIDPIGFLMMLGGLIGWAKPVPINPYRFNRNISMKKGIVLTSVAGPLSNLCLSFIANILLNIVLLISLLFDLGGFLAIQKIIIEILFKMSIININLAIFNILPIPPLDGYKIFGAILPNDVYYRIMRYERYIGLALIFIVFLMPGVLSGVLQVVAKPFTLLLHAPVNFFFEYIFNLLL